METKPYGLYKKNGIYYVRFRNEDGKRQSLSTRQRKKTLAERVALQMYTEHMLSTKGNITFLEYSKNWWIYDSCKYVEYRNRKNRILSQTYVDVNRIYLQKHILPYFGKMKLKKIKREKIEEWHNELIERENLSPTTANHCLLTLKIMLEFAVNKGLLPKSPAKDILNFREEPKAKGIITIDEFKKLFDESKIESIWGGDLFYYTINLLTANTGLRMGEVRALQVKDVDLNNKIIDIKHSYRRKYGLAEPKWSSYRKIPITDKVVKYLKIIIDNMDYQSEDDFIFYGKDHSKPIDEKAISKHLYRALENIGISREDRVNRNITFHSWRHFYNSYLYEHLPLTIVQGLTGHKSKKMTLHYYHEGQKDYSQVYQILEVLNE